MDLLKDKNLLWLAPLAGLTDISFRTICKQWGADVVVSEMVSADGLKYSFGKTSSYARFTEEQRLFGIQIFGSDPQIMAEGAVKAIRFKPDFIDINMGCPVKKVIKRGAGSALMKKPDLAAKIVSSVKAVCQNRLPVTVKIRSGWDINSINAVEFAKMMEQAGADLIIVHPRTRSQMFAGESDWSIIKAVKEQINIPVIGNGDISSIEAAAKMYDQTSCDGLMIGRGVIGKPWIFRQIKLYLQDAEIWKPGSEEIMETIKRHFDLVSADRGEKIAMKEMRTHLAAYTRGYKYSASLRQKINHLNDIPLMIKEIENLIRQSELISDK